MSIVILIMDAKTFKDPVCGMEVMPAHAAGTFNHAGNEYYFCSKHCLDEFRKDPPKFISNSVSSLKTYQPLILIFVYLTGVVFLLTKDVSEFMNFFMAGFFLVFSFFKFLDLKGFVESYRSYDVVAKRFSFYGYLYPFIELALGVAYLTNVDPLATNIATVIVMGVSSIGVIQSILQKRKIQCACLGTMFALPMSTITLIEDLLMVGMAAAMLVHIL